MRKAWLISWLIAQFALVTVMSWQSYWYIHSTVGTGFFPLCITRGRKRHFWVLSQGRFLAFNVSAKYSFCICHWKTWLRVQTWGEKTQTNPHFLLWGWLNTGTCSSRAFVEPPSFQIPKAQLDMALSNLL